MKGGAVEYRKNVGGNPYTESAKDYWERVYSLGETLKVPPKSVMGPLNDAGGNFSGLMGDIGKSFATAGAKVEYHLTAGLACHLAHPIDDTAREKCKEEAAAKLSTSAGRRPQWLTNLTGIYTNLADFGYQLNKAAGNLTTGADRKGSGGEGGGRRKKGGTRRKKKMFKSKNASTRRAIKNTLQRLARSNQTFLRASSPAGLP